MARFTFEDVVKLAQKQISSEWAGSSCGDVAQDMCFDLEKMQWDDRPVSHLFRALVELINNQGESDIAPPHQGGEMSTAALDLATTR